MAGCLKSHGEWFVCVSRLELLSSWSLWGEVMITDINEKCLLVLNSVQLKYELLLLLLSICTINRKHLRGNHKIKDETRRLVVKPNKIVSPFCVNWF